MTALVVVVGGGAAQREGDELSRLLYLLEVERCRGGGSVVVPRNRNRLPLGLTSHEQEPQKKHKYEVLFQYERILAAKLQIIPNSSFLIGNNFVILQAIYYKYSR